jgi:hypothetical protein
MKTKTALGKSDYLKLAVWFSPAAVVIWGIHEFAHWGTGGLPDGIARDDRHRVR